MSADQMTEEEALAILEKHPKAHKHVKNVQATIHNMFKISEEHQRAQSSKIVVPGSEDKLKNAYMHLARAVDEVGAFSQSLDTSNEEAQAVQGICVNAYVQGLEYIRGIIYALHSQRHTADPRRVNQAMMAEALQLL